MHSPRLLFTCLLAAALSGEATAADRAPPARTPTPAPAPAPAPTPAREDPKPPPPPPPKREEPKPAPKPRPQPQPKPQPKPQPQAQTGQVQYRGRAKVRLQFAGPQLEYNRTDGLLYGLILATSSDGMRGELSAGFGERHSKDGVTTRSTLYRFCASLVNFKYAALMIGIASDVVKIQGDSEAEYVLFKEAEGGVVKIEKKTYYLTHMLGGVQFNLGSDNVRLNLGAYFLTHEPFDGDDGSSDLKNYVATRVAENRGHFTLSATKSF